MTTVQLDPSFAALATRLFATRDLTEDLASPLSAEDQTVQSMPDTSPTKWHRAHTTWFFETFVLGPHLDGYEPFDPHYNFLFNSYYEAVGDRYPRPRRGLVTRPGAAEIGRYRHAVDGSLGALLGADPAEAVADLVELGIHHEQQHQELLLMDIKHALTNNTVSSAYDNRCHQPEPDPGPMGWVDVAGGVVAVGAAGGDFAFDNEGPRHEALTHPFAIADRLVTCGEWLEFMEDGGYQTAGLWLSDGWYTRNDADWQAPLYWRNEGDGWTVGTLTGRRPIDPNEPVCHVSFYEADAFATWAGARLPTEFEWEAANALADEPGALLRYTGPATADVVSANSLHPRAAGAPSGRLRQFIGDCWEWTASPYRPYPGFSPPEGAIGEYNGKFMINTMVLRGGCALTPEDHVRPTYRNFFHPHTRWHLSGVRLAKD